MALNIAAMQQLATPVTDYLQGHAMRVQEDTNARRMTALEAADTRAQESHDVEMKVADAKFDEITGQQVLAKVQHVMSLPKEERKAFVKQYEPEFISEFEKQHGESWDDIDDDEIEEMGSHLVHKISGDLGIAPTKATPQSKEGKVKADVKSGLLTEKEAASALAPKNTTDFDNFTAAQKDPEFAKFLKEKKGKGLSMTLPDGTVISMGGEGGGVDASELNNPVITKLQDSIVASTDEIDRLNSIGQSFDPKFLEVPGRLKGTALKVKDLAGGLLGDMTPQERGYLEKFSTFKADAAKNLSLILNRLSGAAISPTEGERLKKGIPNDDDSPTEFVSKYKSSVKDSHRAIMRANWALKNGIGVKSVDQLSKVMPLDSIDHVYEDKVNEIWQEMGGTAEAKKAAIKKANEEFGLAR